jgi:hypothetical protein
MRLILNSIICSSLVGCAGVQRPDALVCGVNAKASKLRCRNIKTDYNDDGTVIAGSKPVEIKINSLMDLNAGVFVSAKDFEKVKVWIGDLRDAYNREKVNFNARLDQKPILETIWIEQAIGESDSD